MLQALAVLTRTNPISVTCFELSPPHLASNPVFIECGCGFPPSQDTFTQKGPPVAVTEQYMLRRLLREETNPFVVKL
jgi:hypothetical protein